jgi:hypothetical protein
MLPGAPRYPVHARPYSEFANASRRRLLRSSLAGNSDRAPVLLQSCTSLREDMGEV